MQQLDSKGRGASGKREREREDERMRHVRAGHELGPCEWAGQGEETVSGRVWGRRQCVNQAGLAGVEQTVASHRPFSFFLPSPPLLCVCVCVCVRESERR